MMNVNRFLSKPDKIMRDLEITLESAQNLIKKMDEKYPDEIIPYEAYIAEHLCEELPINRSKDPTDI